MKKRVLWLIFKEMLCTSDIPELLEMGYEVYTAKKISWKARTEGEYITNRFDISLSVDSGLKAQLDEADFFSPISEELWERINENFDLIFIDYYHGQFETVLENFKGSIVLRTLGLPECGSYSEQMRKDYGLHIFNQIDRLYYRFWFAPAYGWLLDKEADVVQQRYVELPFSVRDVATVGERTPVEKVYFLCPQIKMHADSESLYWDALSLFKPKSGRRIPYTVCGNQYLICDFDANVEGELDTATRMENLKNYACVYAPQKRMGDVDSYILKAFVQGTPVVFNRSCELQELSDDAMPGAYATAEEARKKISRLLRGDSTLRKSIVESQKTILETVLNPEKNRVKFQSALEKIEKNFSFRTHKVPMDPYIGIILMDRYSEATMLQVEILLELLQAAVQQSGERVKFCLGYPVGYGYEQHAARLRRIEQHDIPVRKYTLQQEDQRWVSDMLDMKGYPDMPLERISFALNDGRTYFEDCAALLLVLNRNISTSLDIPAVITTRPFGVLVPDYDVDICTNTVNRRRAALNIHLQRMAKFVLLLDDNSKAIATQRNGISEKKIEVIPSLLASVPREGDMGLDGSEQYFLYFVNGEDPVSVSLAEQSVNDYYLKGGQMSAFIVWQNASQQFKSLFWSAQQYRDYMGRSAIQNDVHIVEHHSDTMHLNLEQLIAIMKGAQFAFMPDLFDMQKQVASWLIALNICTICLETASLKALAEDAEATLHCVTEKDVCVFSDMLRLAPQMKKPDARKVDELFVQYANNPIYKILKRRFGVF